ncbi:PKD domain-containing protein [Chitinophaga sancti]|uniref:Ig-like domain-containing protein n=1 Tax=Chitinophaga sancti TaxID=1004 RepID=UPI003F79F0C0
MMPRRALFLFFFLITISVFAQSPPSPTITSFTPASACQGYQVSITGTNFTGVTSVTLGTQPASSFVINSPTSITATVAEDANSGPVTVDGINGGIITIQPSPKPSLQDISTLDAPFTNCNGNIHYTLKVQNTSIVTGTGNKYEINWGDGSPVFTQVDWAFGAQITHAFSSQGYFVVTLKITPPNGCEKTTTYQFYNGQNPIASITTTTSTTGLCAPSPVEFQIGNWFNNSPGTEYILDYGDGTPQIVLPHPLNTTNTIFRISHTYNRSSCPKADFTATLYARNACYTTTYTLNQIVIRSKPVADFSVVKNTFCLDDNVCITNKTSTGTSGNSCSSNTEYEWNFGDGYKSTLRDPGCHKYAAPGNYTITLNATSITCGTDTKSINITILPISPAPLVTTPIFYCQGATATPLTATGTNIKWYTSGGNLLANPPTPATNFPGSTTYYVTQTLPGQCESPKAPLVVTVNALPASPIVTSPVSLCQGATAAPLTATGTGLKWYAADGTLLPAAPIPSTAAAGSTSYFVTQTISNCEGPKAEIVVTIGTTPVAPVVNTPVNYCQGQAASPLTASGTGLSWYDAGGTLLAGAPVPATATPGTTTYYVSQRNGCGESQRVAITVNVNPAPTATISYSPATLCNGAGSPPVNVTLAGSPGGTYSAPAGLIINTTTGTITPAGSTPGTYTIRYTLPGSGGCASVVATTTVSINGTPAATISYPAMCASDGVTAATINGSTGGVFAASTGLTINASTGAITPASSTPGTYTVTYDIAAAAPCPAFHTTATVTITKAPTATISYSPVNLCNTSGSTTVNVSITGDPGGTYSITPSGMNIDPATGTLSPAGASPGNYTIRYTLTGSGGCTNFISMTTVTVSSTPNASILYAGSPYCGDLSTTQAVTQTGSGGGTYSAPAGLSINAATGAIIPSASTPGTYTVTYTIAAAPPCPGFQTTTNITITRPPAATIAYTPAILCNTSSSAAVNVTRNGDAGGAYSISPAGMTIDPTTGTLSPAGASPGIYTITYTLPGSGGCNTVTASTTVTVNSTPFASISYNGSPFCGNVNIPQAVTQVGTPGGTFSAPTGLTINVATGAITPASSTPGTYTVTYTIAAAPPCPGFQTTTNITITRPPAATIAYTPAILCNTSSSAAVNVTRNGDAGGAYSISPAGMTIDPTTGTLSPAGASPGIYTITYTLPGSGGCNNVTATTTVTVNNTPTATISYNGSPFCSNMNTPQAVSQAGTPGGTFSAPAGLSINATTGAIIPSASTPGTYTVTYTIAPAPPCPGFQTTTSITIYESPLISFPVPDQEVCSNQSATFTPASSVPNTNYSWAVSGTLPANVTGISSGNFTGNLSLLYINKGNSDVVITVRVIPYNPVQTTCAGAAYDLHLTVHPEVPAPVSSDVSTCMGAAAVTLQAMSLPGYSIRWYDAQQTLLPAAPVIPTSDSVRLQYYVNQRSSFGCEGPKVSVIAIVHPTLKITGADFSNPTACGVPSGTIVLQTSDLNDQVVPNVPVIVHYKKFQTDLVASGFTDSNGRITLPLTAGSYTGFYAESTGGCTTAHLSDVFVLKDPDPPAKPVAGYNPPICSETPLTLTALSATSPQDGEIKYVWAGPAFGPYPDTVNNTVVTFPSASVADAGTYVVYATQHNCISDADSFIVVINRSPSKPVISTRNPLCVGDELYLSASSSIGDNSTLTYLWTGPGRGFPVNGTHAGIDKVALTDAGRYTIIVTSSETGCTSTTDTLIEIGNYPIIKFATDTLILPTGFKITLDPAIQNATEPGILPMQNYTWSPADDLTCNDALCDKPILTVKNDACYAVKATNVYGCSDSDTICVRAFCKDAQVFVPNAFTPDGLPENRILMVRASGIATVKSFRIFNRWGRVMYERSNFAPNSSEYGWNGYINGKKADTGVYIYTVEVICENGTPYTLKGNVTLF